MHEEGMVMKKILLLATLLGAASIAAHAQGVRNAAADVQVKLALRELVDTFSNLADVKDTKGQVLLFTPDGGVRTLRGGREVSSLDGRDKMEAAFAAFLKNFDTVYHFNGQHTVSVNGNNATGTLYCLVTLIGTENGKRMKTTIGVIYKDEYVREQGRWLIAKRVSDFTWQDKAPFSG
jgi:SnoaL-like domain